MAGSYRNRTLVLLFGNRWCQAGVGLRRNFAYFLLYIEPDIAIDIDARRNAQDDAGVAIVDGVDDRVAGRQHRGAAGGNRHDIADLERGGLVVDHDERWVRQDLDSGNGMKRVQNTARL